MGTDVKSPAMSIGRLRSATDKFGWGLRAVGPLAAARGFWRIMNIWLRRPDHAEVHLLSGPTLEFDYPGQFPPTLMMFGDFIDPEFAFLLQVARPNWRVVDVGAAIGQFSMFAATCLVGARVDAFEPSSANVATLKRNIVRNGVEGRVSVHQAALSNRKDTAQFQTAPKTWMSQLMRADSANADSELVAVDTLDDMLKALQLERVEILKINVAGFEPAVLEGAMGSLCAGQVDIMVLLLGLPSLPHYEAIAALGYRFFYYHPPKRTLFEVREFDADAVLAHRPWPARHILAIRSAVVESLVAGQIVVRALDTSPKMAAG